MLKILQEKFRMMCSNCSRFFKTPKNHPDAHLCRDCFAKIVAKDWYNKVIDNEIGESSRFDNFQNDSFNEPSNLVDYSTYDPENDFESQQNIIDEIYDEKNKEFEDSVECKFCGLHFYHNPDALEYHEENHQNDIKIEIRKEDEYDNRIIEFIADNQLEIASKIVKRFPKANLAFLERQERIEWNKKEQGWILTQKEKSKKY